MACEPQEFDGFWREFRAHAEQLGLYQSRLAEILRPCMRSSLGIDYGTNSVRALIVDCSNGAELGSYVVDYPSGHQGVLLDRKNHHLTRQTICSVSKKASRVPLLYRSMHDAFGGVITGADLSKEMKELIAIKQGLND